MLFSNFQLQRHLNVNKLKPASSKQQLSVIFIWPRNVILPYLLLISFESFSGNYQFAQQLALKYY
jgi:hypothetical protein